MKLPRLASLAIAVAALFPSLTSCSGDPNPFDKTTSTEEDMAVIRLKLNVASTRANDDPLSTDDEKKVSKVSVYIFDESNRLEIVEENLTVSSETLTEKIKVKPGIKTLYAISGDFVLDPVKPSIGTDIKSFEESILDSQMSHLKNSTSGFVMSGKSESQKVMKSANAESIPQSNVFDIELVRLVAKTQVKLGNIDMSDLGFKMLYDPIYKVSQTCNRMRLKSNNTNVFNFADRSDSDGTYEGYTVDKDTQMTVIKEDFSKDNCLYLSENIVDEPVAGNTTFVTLVTYLQPLYVYSYFYSLSKTEAGNNVMNFYAVALVDDVNGLEDFAIDPGTKHVITFTDLQHAERYASALNGGNASASTVSQSETQLTNASFTRAEYDPTQFHVVYFDNGKSFYRINIKDGDIAKVVRNKFYKITVNSINNLGFHSEDLLRPLNPEASLESANSALIDTKFSVAPWDGVSQEVNL